LQAHDLGGGTWRHNGLGELGPGHGGQCRKRGEGGQAIFLLVHVGLSRKAGNTSTSPGPQSLFKAFLESHKYLAGMGC
jgi:hypothetical protein